MTKSPKSDPQPSSPAAEDESVVASPEPAPPPEPWTPARVVEWNAYYDIYIAVAVVLLTFIVGSNRITHSAIWTQLQTGKVISETMSPQLTDKFSYSAEGQRWVHISWLADVVHYQVFRLVGSFAPIDGDDVAAQTARRDQWGAAGLIGLTALLRGLTAFLILQIRRRGPGLWWACVCVAFALAAVLTPLGLLLGGVAGRAVVSPEVWGNLLLAVELLLLHRGLFLGKRGSLYGLIPLFLVWANFDESFLVGLFLLVAAVAGMVVKSKNATEAGPRLKDGLIVLAGSFAATFANPSLFWIYPASISTIIPFGEWIIGPITGDVRSPFSGPINPGDEDELRRLKIVQSYYAIVVGLGLGSFLLNRRRFNLSRFLMYATGAVLWAIMFRFQSEFALVLAMTLILNGQEWYHDQFGTEGRLGRGWAVWSIGGRAVTLLFVALLMIRTYTGFGSLEGEAVFGYGFTPDDFPFEAAEFLATSPFEGNVFNTSLAQGDALIWKTNGVRKTFLDSRKHLFPPQVIASNDELQRAIRDDDIERWKPALDQYNISAVMIEEARSPKTYRQLITSPRWIPFRDDGATVMFGRADAPAADVAYFNKNRLDAEVLVYKNPQMAPSTDKLPRATTDLDRIYQNRFLGRPQPHSVAAQRWLLPVTIDPSQPYMPDPARAIMAIREARSGLAANVDDTTSYRRLVAGYRTLFVEESALLAGIELTPENTQTIAQTPMNSGVLANRFRQLVTALVYAIQTTPPPSTPEARQDLAQLNLEVAQLFLNAGYIDLARDRFLAVIDGTKEGDLPQEVYTNLTTQLTTLNQAINEIENALQTLSIEQQANPVQQAMFAQQRGALGLAIQRLEEASQAGVNPALVKGTLLDLYCESGQPDKALELWQTGNTADPVLGDGPGTAAVRQGRVFLLMGNYANAIAIWNQQGIPALAASRAMEVPGATRALLRGEAQATTRAFLEIPDKISRQAYWEFELGMAAIEAGMPVDFTAKHLSAALTLSPDLVVRPVIAYYLTKLGQPVPPTRAEAAKAIADAAKPPATPAPQPSKPAEAPKPADAPKAEATKPAEAAKPATPKP